MRRSERKREAPAEPAIRLDDLPSAALMCDSQGRVIQANRAASKLFERNTDVLIGCSTVELLGRDLLWFSSNTSEHMLELPISLPGGRSSSLQASVSTNLDANGASRTMVLLTPAQRAKENAIDVTPQVVAWSEVAKRMSDYKSAVLCAAFGVVGLRSINDGFSRSTGDFVLAEIGRRLASVPGTPTTVCRIGGSRFLLVTAATSDNDRLLASLMAAVAQPVETPLGLAAVGCASGAVSGPCRSPLLLIDQADRNLDTALLEGAGTVSWHSGNERSSATAGARLAAPLLAGLSAGSISAEFSPIVDADTGEIVEYRAAACWNDENGTLRSAREFVDVANDLGVISDVGWIVTKAAIDLAVELNRDGRQPPIRVSVSVSGREVCKGGFTARIGDMMAVAGVRPESLQFELSGGVAPHYVRRLNDAIGILREMGVGIRITSNDASGEADETAPVPADAADGESRDEDSDATPDAPVQLELHRLAPPQRLLSLVGGQT
jgi:GGDEF domain-containing protein